MKRWRVACRNSPHEAMRQLFRQAKENVKKMKKMKRWRVACWNSPHETMRQPSRQAKEDVKICDKFVCKNVGNGPPEQPPGDPETAALKSQIGDGRKGGGGGRERERERERERDVGERVFILTSEWLESEIPLDLGEAGVQVSSDVGDRGGGEGVCDVRIKLG